MRIAFYAPMKPPDNPVPSGDRRVARLLLAALRQGGYEPEIVSRLRSWDGAGDAAAQQRIRDAGAHEADRLIAAWRGAPAAARPKAWFTYHLYHKAPDWIGPPAAAALDIPYIVAEASFAPKQAGGPWTSGHAAVAAALRQAAAVIGLNPTDSPCLRALLGPGAPIHELAPFTDIAPFRAAASARATHRAALMRRLGLAPERPILITVGMMRPGDKLASYQRLAGALAKLTKRDWQLVIVGDGAARIAVEQAFAAFPQGRVHYAGMAEDADLPGFYAGADLMVWPAVNEAYGMALLEAQAAGLPVIAGAGGGVSAVVADGITGTIIPDPGATQFAAGVSALLDAPDRRADMRKAALARTQARHSLDAASGRLGQVLATTMAAAA